MLPDVYVRLKLHCKTTVILSYLPTSHCLMLIFFPATVYIKMKKPNAAIRDANVALEVVLNFLDVL